MTVQCNFIGMVTADMAASLAFYRKLGLDIPADSDDRPHVEAPLPGGMRLAWDSTDAIRAFDPGFELPASEGRIGLGFECDSPAEVDRVYAEMLDAGYKSHRAPWDAFWGQRYAQIHDPDGNVVDLYAALS